MNKVVLEKLKGYSKEEIDLALKCLDLDEMTLLEANNYEDSITEALNFIADKMVEFLKFREYVLSKNPLFGYFKDLCPFQMRFNNTLKKLSVEDLDLINSLFKSEINISEEDIVKAFNKVVPQINYDLIVFTSHTDPFFKSYFKNYHVNNISVALGNLNNKELDLLFKAYGRNLDQMKNSKKLTNEEEKYLSYTLLPKITKYLTRVEQPVYKFNLKNVIRSLQNQGLEQAILMLPNQHKEFVFRHFNKDFNSYDNVLDFDKEDYDYLLNTIIPLIKNSSFTIEENIDYSNFWAFWDTNDSKEIVSAVLTLKQSNFYHLTNLYGPKLDRIKKYLSKNDEKKIKKTLNIIKSIKDDEKPNISIVDEWKELIKGYSENVIKLSCIKVSGVYKEILEKFLGKEHENINNPNIDNLTIEDLWKLKNTIFALVKKNLKIFGKEEEEKKVSEEYKLFLDGVFKDYTKEEVLVAISTLKEKYINYLSELYGQNYDRPVVVWSKKQFSDVVNIVIPSLKKTLDSDEFKTLLANSKNFFKMFDVKRNIVLEAITCLDEQEITLLKQLYGKDLTQQLNLVGISNKEYVDFRKNTLKKISDRIKVLTKPKERKINDYKYFFNIFNAYTDEEKKNVLDKVSLLQEKYIQILKKAYGENFDERMNRKNLTNNEYYTLAQTIIKKLFRLLSGENTKRKYASKYSNFFTSFNATTLEQRRNLLEKIKLLPQDQINILQKMYGMDYTLTFTKEKITDEEYNIFRTRTVKNLNKLLEGKNLIVKNDYTYFFNFLKITDDEEKNVIREKMKLLPQNYQYILKRLYGDDLNQAHNINDLSPSEKQTFYKNIVPKILNLVYEHDYFYNIFKITEEESRQGLRNKLSDLLPDRYMNIVKLMYGENLTDRLNYAAITYEDYNIFNRLIIPLINKIILGKKIRKLHSIKENASSYEYFFIAFGADTEEKKEQLKDKIKLLSLKYQQMLQDIYGVNLDERLNRKSQKALSNFYPTIVPKIKNLMINHVYFYNIFGITEEANKVELFNQLKILLPSEYFEILQKMYGEDLNDEFNYKLLTIDEYTIFNNKIIRFVKKIKEGKIVQKTINDKYNKYRNFYKAFGANTEEEKEQLKDKLKLLPLKYQQQLRELYGENLEQDLYSTNKSLLNNFYQTIAPKIINLMTTHVYFYSIFEITEEANKVGLYNQLKILLPSEYFEILQKMYGDDLNNELNYNQIDANEYYIFTRKIINYVKRIIEGKVTQKNESKNKKAKQNSYQYLFVTFNITDDKSKEVLKDRIKLLPKQNRDLLKKIYGVELDQAQNLKDLTSKEINEFYGSVIPKLKQIFYTYSKFYYIFNITEENEKVELLATLDSKLSKEYLAILKKIYGEDLNDEFNSEFITEEEYSIFKGAILKSVTKIINYKNIKPNNKYQYFFEIFGRDENTKSEVKAILNYFDKKNLNILTNLYGSSLEDELDISKIRSDEYYIFVRTIVPKIFKMLNLYHENERTIDIVNENKIASQSEELSSTMLDIYRNPLFLHLATLLPEKDCIIWMFYWGLSGKKLSLKEIANMEAIQLAEREVINSLKNSAELINNTITHLNEMFNCESITKLIRKESN